MPAAGCVISKGAICPAAAEDTSLAAATVPVGYEVREDADSAAAKDTSLAAAACAAVCNVPPAATMPAESGAPEDTASAAAAVSAVGGVSEGDCPVAATVAAECCVSEDAVFLASAEDTVFAGCGVPSEDTDAAGYDVPATCGIPEDAEVPAAVEDTTPAAATVSAAGGGGVAAGADFPKDAELRIDDADAALKLALLPEGWGQCTLCSCTSPSAK